MPRLAVPRLLPRRLARWSLLAAGALLAVAGPLQAQSLVELYDVARDYDARYLAARSQADAAVFVRAQADALRRPTVGLQAQANRSATDPVTPATPDRGYGNVIGAGVVGRHPLYNAANRTTIDQADRALEIARIELALAEQDLILRLSQAYFDVLVAQETLTSRQATKAAFAEQLASAQRNFEVGTATITDAREAQARFDLATAREIQAENDLRSKRIALDQLVGRANVAPKPLRLPALLSNTVPGSIDDWVVLAESSHPAIRRAQFGLELAQLEIDKARAGSLPTVDLVANVQHAYTTGVVGLGTAFGRQSGHSTSGSVGVELNLPLYTGQAVQNRVKEKLALAESARNNLADARRGVTQATRQAYIGFRSLEASVVALEAAEASSKLALEATQVGYRVGVRVNVDVLNAQSQLFETQAELARARYDTLLAALRLRQASGTLQAPDLQLVNRLLQP